MLRRGANLDDDLEIHGLDRAAHLDRAEDERLGDLDHCWTKSFEACGYLISDPSLRLWVSRPVTLDCAQQSCLHLEEATTHRARDN